jgi:hypothetical protein
MFERTRRKIAFTDEGRRFVMYALTYYRNDLLSREGFTDQVDDVSCRIAKCSAGRRMTFLKNDFDLLMYALAQWFKALQKDPKQAQEYIERVRTFILETGETPDMTGKKYWKREEAR